LFWMLKRRKILRWFQTIRGSRYLSPFFKNSDISKFRVKKSSEKYIIFSCKNDPATNDRKLGKHLEVYKGILTRIREINKENTELWPVLRRGASNVKVFNAPKIVCPQRSKLNTFGYNEGPWYAASDVFFITETEDSSVSLKYLLGLLNSKLCYVWLYFMGKRKGESLELIAKPISEIPIQKGNRQTQQSILKCVERLIKNPDDRSAFSELNANVYEIYGLTKEEAKFVERFYDSKTSDRSAKDEFKREAA
jgi:adenine-specific DNA-methyltransferase